jgi:hypothetical protein
MTVVTLCANAARRVNGKRAWAYQTACDITQQRRFPMSIRTSLFAFAAILALAATSLASTEASASWGRSVGRYHGVISGHYIPGCGHIGCNMKW